MHTLSLKKSIALTLLSLLLASTASAGLVGDTVGTRYYGSSGDDSGVNLSVVGAGDEGNFFANQFYNFGDFDFSIRSVAPFGGIFSTTSTDLVSLELSGLDFPGALTGVTFQTNLTGVSYVMNANAVTFTWNEQAIAEGTYLTAQFNSSNAVPEAVSSLSLLGLALLGLVAVRRKLS